MLNSHEGERVRQLLCALQEDLLTAIDAARGRAREQALHAVAEVTEADTIYAIDKVSEDAILAWFAEHWPREWPVEIVMEGLEVRGPRCSPEGTAVSATRFKCILDPIDGTRGIMYDKRPAWVLAGLAPQRGPETCLQDIVVAAMTELPTTKQWRADQLSVAAGDPLVAEAIDVRSGTRALLDLRPSGAGDLEHGFAALCRFFPEGMALMAEMEVALWDRLPLPATGTPTIFTDQYLTTGGQLYELMAGHDRFLADVRPWVFRHLGLDSALTCHPYDICVWPVAVAAGVIVENPATGGPLDAPLDTTTPVGWAAYANPRLRELIAPALAEVLREFCPRAFD